MSNTEESDNLRAINDTDVDLSDETQDFRFLSLLSKADATSTSLPKRGEKDFEPDGTKLQELALADSRQAMTDALSGERTQSSKLYVSATWRPSRLQAEVESAKGGLFKAMGR